MEAPTTLAEAQREYVGRKVRKLFLSDNREEQWFSGEVKTVWKDRNEGILYRVW